MLLAASQIYECPLEHIKQTDGEPYLYEISFENNVNLLYRYLLLEISLNNKHL